MSEYEDIEDIPKEEALPDEIAAMESEEELVSQEELFKVLES